MSFDTAPVAEAAMLEQFIPLYCVLVGGAFAAGVAAIQMSHRLMVQTARARALRPTSIELSSLD